MSKQKLEVKDAAVGVRIPLPLKDLIDKIVELDAHMNMSDFIRDALREKVQRDAPHMYRLLLNPETSE